MARPFSIELADLTVELRFERPDFLLLGVSANRFVHAVFPFLERYGSTPQDVTFGNAASVGERHAHVMAPRISAGVKLSVAKVDVGVNDLLKVSFEDVQVLVLGAMSALTQVEAANKVAAYSVTLNVHGGIAGASAADYIGRYFQSRPKGLGPDTGGALAFYYGQEGARYQCAVIVDGSALVPSGLYLRVAMTYDAKKLSAEEVLKAGKADLGKVFASLELTQTRLDL